MTAELEGSPADRAKQRAAIVAHVEGWRAFFGTDTGFLHVIVTSDANTMRALCRHPSPSECVLDSQERNPGKLLVWAGHDMELPALFHGICHTGPASRFYGVDRTHQDQEWTLWDDEGNRIAASLR